jgi:FkbM family methyltransferase
MSSMISILKLESGQESVPSSGYPSWLVSTDTARTLADAAATIEGIALEALPPYGDEIVRLQIDIATPHAADLLAFAILVQVQAGSAVVELWSPEGKNLDYALLTARPEPYVLTLVAPTQEQVFFHLRPEETAGDAALLGHAAFRVQASSLDLAALWRAPELARHDTWPASAWARPGPENLGGRLRDQGFCRLAAPVAVNWLGGVRLLLEPDDQQSRCVATYGFYEPESMFALGRILRPGDVFVDVGANAGVYTLFAAQAVGPTGRVIACEPSRRELARLRANLAANDLPQVEIINAGVSEAPGAASLLLAEPYLARHNSMFLAPPGRSGIEVVKVTTLDRILTSAKRCDCIKIDVEGAELLVLRGGAEAIERFRPKLLIEFNAKTLAAAQTSAAEIAGWLGARRYHLYEIAPENGELSPVRLVPVGPSRNLLALPAP